MEFNAASEEIDEQIIDKALADVQGISWQLFYCDFDRKFFIRFSFDDDDDRAWTTSAYSSQPEKQTESITHLVEEIKESAKERLQQISRCLR